MPFHGFIVVLLLFADVAEGDVVLAWCYLSQDLFRSERTSPPVASRQMAILHTAIFDAVNSISPTHNPYAVTLPPISASQPAAANAAGHDVLIHFYPSNATQIDALYNQQLALLDDDGLRSAGIARGKAVAALQLSYRASDGSTASVPVKPPITFMDWVPTPPGFLPFLLPQWGQMTPFAMNSPNQFRPPGPPPFDSQTWVAAFNEVKTLGGVNSAVRTPHEGDIGRFWADGGGTCTPPGHWNLIAATVSEAHGLSLVRNARLFALLNVALADSAIACWDAKYTYNNLRPLTAIRNATMDGNPATTPDPTWTPLLITPNFPDYVSGHSTFSGAGAVLLGLYFGTDNVNFTSTSDGLPGAVWSYPSFTAAASEAAWSRVLAGIHYRFASADGMGIGYQVASWTFTHTMSPLPTTQSDSDSTESTVYLRKGLLGLLSLLVIIPLCCVIILLMIAICTLLAKTNAARKPVVLVPPPVIPMPATAHYWQ